jgi:SPP1 family predicted phage head-tail adaptor
VGNPLTAAGRIDRRVTIERATAERNAVGQRVESWAATATRFAAVAPAPGTERFASGETAANAPMRFVFRWEPDLVRVTDRLLHEDGRHYDVQSVTEIGRREGWEVLAVARAETEQE